MAFSDYNESASLNTSIGGKYTGENMQRGDVDAVLRQLAADGKSLINAFSGTVGSSMVGFIQAGTGAVARDAQSKLREIRSFEDFGCKPDGQIPMETLKECLDAAWASALANGHDLFHPGGTYEIDYHFPWRQTPEYLPGPVIVPLTSLLDCGNVTIYGNGPTSIFKTKRAGEGADVFNLFGLKNIHFRDFAITGEITGAYTVGTNGISIVGGYDNITIDNVLCYDLPSADRTGFGDYIDGGKAVTLQNDTASGAGWSVEIGTLKANYIARGCSQGFGFEGSLEGFVPKKVSVDIDLIAEDCFTAMTAGAGAATGAVPVGFDSGVRVKALSINCQKDVILGRMHGVTIYCNIVTTKSAAARRLSPTGTAWNAGDTNVEAFVCTYAKNGRINIYGYKGECDYKARIGGAGAGASGQTGATEYTNITLDIGGTMLGGHAAILAVDSGGNIMTNSALMASTTTLSGTAMPDTFYLPVYNNIIVHGTKERLSGLLMNGDIEFSDPNGNGKAVAFRIGVNPAGLLFSRQQQGSGAGLLIHSFYDDANTRAAGIRNDGAFHSKAATVGGPSGAVTGKFPFYDDSNTLIGYAELKAL